MRILVRASGVLLAAGLAGLYVQLQEIRFALAAAAILCLAELALALRARAGNRPVRGDPSRMTADRVAYTEEDGVLAVTLSGTGERRETTPYVVLSRRLRPPANTTAEGRGPCLELSPVRGPLAGSIEDAYLSPQLLRLALDARATEALGSQTLCVTLPAGTDQRLLERALSRILRGVPFTSDRSVPEGAIELSRQG